MGAYLVEGRRPLAVVVAVAAVLALVGARPYAGGWNDGSRLATIESLVDHHTLAIDDSIFVKVPPDGRPYPAHDGALRENGTFDKMLIDGHFYSDKPPVPALLAAALYWGLQRSTGLTARDDTALFCWLMAVGTSGLAFVATAAGWWRIAERVGFTGRPGLLLTLLFLTATVAVSYARVVNGHTLLLAATTAMLAVMLGWNGGAAPLRRLAWLGTLGGFAYATDYGAGPIVFAGLGPWVAYRCWHLGPWRRRVAGVAVFGLCALPWLVTHHAILYRVSGMLAPPSTNPAFFQFPHSPFTAQNLSGGWHHAGPFAFVLYGVDLLVGQRGFLGHNLMLYLAAAGLPVLFRRRLRERPVLLCAATWVVAVVLAYTATTNNYAGTCVSIRWFVPLLGPGFLALAVLLREYPEYRRDCWLLGLASVPWVWLCWWTGPWARPPVLYYWLFMGLGLETWCVYRLHRWGAFRRLRAWKAIWRFNFTRRERIIG